MLAIHNSKSGFNKKWIQYCNENNISYKLVDCYDYDLIYQLKDCKALLWHHSQNDPKALIAAKSILFSLEHSDIKVFPDFRSNWHFDDKLGQKYLLEYFGIPFVKTWVFFEKAKAIDWAYKTNFPKVFKLRGGAGSSNVKLVKSRSDAFRIINQAFNGGFSNYDRSGQLIESIRKWRIGKVDFFRVLKSFVRFFIPPQYDVVLGKERDYIYFQEYIANNDFDIRVIVIGDKAFAIKRMVRKNDFRASGSGHILYEKEHFEENWIKLAFQINEKLKMQCLALDYVFESGSPKVVEISYGFEPMGYENCVGYWDINLKWYEGKFNPYGWMIDLIVKSL